MKYYFFLYRNLYFLTKYFKYLIGKASVLYFLSEDIEWFKPVMLRTLHGRRGHIKEALGDFIFNFNSLKHIEKFPKREKNQLIRYHKFRNL